MNGQKRCRSGKRVSIFRASCATRCNTNVSMTSKVNSVRRSARAPCITRRRPHHRNLPTRPFACDAHRVKKKNRKEPITMKSLALTTCALLLILVGCAATAAQNADRVRISRIAPYDKAVPGQILELHFEGLAAGANAPMLPLEDFQIEVTQAVVKQTILARVVSPTMTRETNPDGTVGEMKRLQTVSFLAPQGLHPGEVAVLVSYHNQQSDP